MQAEYFDRRGRPSFIHRLAAVIEHRAHLAEDLADDEGIAEVQSALLHEHGGDCAAATIQFCFENHAGCEARSAGAQIQNVRSQQNRFEQRLEVLAFLRGHFDHFRFAAPRNGIKALLRQFLTHAIGIRVGLVDLVDGHNDRHARSA